MSKLSQTKAGVPIFNSFAEFLKTHPKSKLLTDHGTLDEAVTVATSPDRGWVFKAAFGDRANGQFLAWQMKVKNPLFPEVKEVVAYVRERSARRSIYPRMLVPVYLVERVRLVKNTSQKMPASVRLLARMGFIAKDKNRESIRERYPSVLGVFNEGAKYYRQGAKWDFETYQQLQRFGSIDISDWNWGKSGKFWVWFDPVY